MIATIWRIPAAGGSQTLPRAVGTAAALEFLLSGRWLNAEEANKMKLVNRVVAREYLLPTAEAMAKPAPRACARKLSESSSRATGA